MSLYRPRQRAVAPPAARVRHMLGYLTSARELALMYRCRSTLGVMDIRACLRRCQFLSTRLCVPWRKWVRRRRKSADVEVAATVSPSSQLTKESEIVEERGADVQGRLVEWSTRHISVREHMLQQAIQDVDVRFLGAASQLVGPPHPWRKQSLESFGDGAMLSATSQTMPTDVIRMRAFRLALGRTRSIAPQSDPLQGKLNDFLANAERLGLVSAECGRHLVRIGRTCDA